MRRMMSHQEVDAIRSARGRSMLLFVTDRCPVGCAHCSVDSRPDSPTISDFALFTSIVSWISEDAALEVVGISGGEPFAERRGLTFASEQLTDAGKQLVIFTSGLWASARGAPGWAQAVLRRCSCVYLSTDAFHAAGVSDERLVRAAASIVEAGAWLVVQVLARPGEQARAVRLLAEGLGARWRDHAELNLIVPLTSGRGAQVFHREAATAGDRFGSCSLVRSPMVRYDGLVTGCCNEGVIRSRGPARLRRRARDAQELDAAVHAFHADPLLRVIGDVGLGALTRHPRFRDLAAERFATNCGLCWKVLQRMPDPQQRDRLVDAIAALPTGA